MKGILLVEDSDELRKLISDFFERKGISDLVSASDGYAGMKLIEEREFDLAILDIMIPGPSGFDLCRELRKRSNCPIMFLTALGSEDSILKGYGIGADEYVVKPFSLNVLYAKCLALMSRAGGGIVGEKVMHIGGIELYEKQMGIKVGGEEVALAPKEYLLLKTLMENSGHVLTRDMLLDLVWGRDFDGTDRVVDNHVKKLRRKLGSEGDHIKTVIGGGYKIT